MTPHEVLMTDPFSEATRKDRKALLGISIIGIVIVKSGLVPTKISALGVDFTSSDQKVIITSIGLIVLYFLVAFILYAIPDYFSRRERYNSAVSQLYEDEAREYRELSNPDYDHMRLYKRRPIFFKAVTSTLPILRTIFDFYFPILLGIYSAMLLFVA